ncbi:MAG: BREX system Lon protease-like protein BrxL [Christensenellaceae bacterium]|jgi:ATP-dependent Lon protease|nr:BREX system Lon protease-like protein BrxL [Christensenellaceae bacterium]
MRDELIERLKNTFNETVVYKDLKKTNFFSSINLPCFMRDYLIQKFRLDDKQPDMDKIKKFINTYLPRSDQWLAIKDKLIMDNEPVKILTKIKVDIDIKTAKVDFNLPDFKLKKGETIIKDAVWDKVKEHLTNDREVWGIVELKYITEIVGKKEVGLIALKSFKKFSPYEVDLENFKEMRTYFTVQEWIDIILGAVDYNPDGYNEINGYDARACKFSMIKRLLPFIEKRINIIELAPKGTGKSYLFGRLSKFGYLLSGGKISRSNLFFNKQKESKGLIFHYDFIGIDEIQTISCDDQGDMRSVLKTYMEEGAYRGDKRSDTSFAGIVLLGNLDQEEMNVKGNLFSKLPTLFKESALLDRFHGFIEGWKIPRLNEDLKMTGFALNTEYFTHILHCLRDDITYRRIVDEIVVVPEKADTRDTEAIKRLTTGFLKLLFPSVRSAEDVDIDEFSEYCLEPAKNMRGIILYQLGLLDAEYRGKKIPNLKVVKKPKSSFVD